MGIGDLFPVLTLLLGWALNEFGLFRRLRREDRRAAGPVLTELLDIRHRLVSVDAGMKCLCKELQIAGKDRLQFDRYLQALVPEPPGFGERYEQAVSNLALIDPVLAFDLRGKSLIMPVLRRLQDLAASEHGGADVWLSVIKPKLMTKAVPKLEAQILEIARAHGWRTWWRVHRLLKKPVLDLEYEELVSELIAETKNKTTDESPGR